MPPAFLAGVIGALDVGVTVIDRRAPGSPIVFANEAFLAMTGYGSGEVVGQGWRFLHGAGTEADAVRRLEEAVRAGGTLSVQLVNYRRDGTPFWNALRLAPVPDGTAGPSRFIVCAHHDVTDRAAADAEMRRATRAPREREARLEAVIETSPDGIMLIDGTGTIVRANPSAERMFGFGPGGLAGHGVGTLMPAARAADVGGDVASAVRREVEGARAGGGSFPVELTVGKIDEGGERLLVAFVRDLTEARRAEAALRESGHRFREVADNLPVIVWTIDAGGACTYVNRRWYEHTGQPPGEGEGQGWLACVHPGDLAAVGGEMEARMGRREPFRIEYRLRRRDGAWRWMLDAGAPFIDRAGVYRGYVGSVVDIDERRQAEARVRHLAHHDVLTGLPNRTLFEDRLEQALAQARRSGQGVGLLLLDLDRFKGVNDTLGHDAGDALLRCAAGRLRACVRASDTVARLGGDEFAVVLPGLVGPDVVAEVARRITAAMGEPVLHAGHVIRTAASVGIALYPGDGTEADQLLKSGDLALYRVKAEGGGGHRFFKVAV